MSNHKLEAYDFYHRDSHTLAGGVGLYIKTYLTANWRDDMENSTDDFETIWVETNNNKDKIMVGVVIIDIQIIISQLSKMNFLVPYTSCCGGR